MANSEIIFRENVFEFLEYFLESKTARRLTGYKPEACTAMSEDRNL